VSHSNSWSAPQSFQSAGIGLLLRLKARALKNHVFQSLQESPIRLMTAVGAMVLIWCGLLVLFQMVLKFIQEDTLQGIVAIPLIFDFFFVALLFMLIFSNAVIAYGSLFERNEPAYLLTQPIKPTRLVLLKLLESMIFSSWSLVLIGLPLMVSMAQVTSHLPWYYYPLFIAFFLCFVPIPAAVGVFLAWLVGIWFSRIARRVLYLALIVVAGGISIWFWKVWGMEYTDSRLWLKEFFERASLVQGTFWPSTWVSKGLDYARNDELNRALSYLLVTFANGVFLSWLAVKVVGQRFLLAYDRVQTSGRKTYYDGQLTRKFAAVLFWYLPDELRELALKDLRTFLRDPTQWSQLLILLGLLGLYVINIPNVPVKLDAFDFQLLISFLNMTAISLILATFTSRFVFPLLSLEMQQMWLIGMLPMPRGRMLWPKFAFALSVTFISGGTVLTLAAGLSDLAFKLLALDLIVITAVCVGLCGMAVGLGSRFPMLNERNHAKIANGLGGTINLIVSLIMVVIMMSLCCVLGLHFKRLGAAELDTKTFLLLGAVLGVGLLSALIPLWLGRRRFASLEV